MIPTKEEWQNALEKRHGCELQKNFSSSTVAICGLGGLGSNIAISLARAGVGKLILVDYDRVDLSNLHRQQYKVSQIDMYKTDAIREIIREIAPYVELETYTIRLTEENAKNILRNAHVVCEAFDDAEEKSMLANIVLSQMKDKYLVSSSGMAGLGSGNKIHTRRITSKFYLCGDEESDASGGIGLISSRVMICAAHQSHMVLRILAKEFEE